MPFFDLKDPDLTAYRSAVTPPDDFDTFWAETLAETREHKLDAVFAPVDVGLQVFDVFDVTFSGFGGHRIKGWFIRPKAARAERCVVKFIGYGGGRDKPHTHLLWPATGRSVLVMDTRGQGSSWSTSDTPDPAGSDPAHPGYMTRGILDPKTYYYRRVFVDGVRAVEAARSRAEIDPDRVAITGGSQGGGIAIAVAGLDPKVWVTMPDVPYLCDFPRSVGLAVRDPYNEIVRYLSVHRNEVDTVFATLRYFDGVNLGRWAKARALFSLGLMDDICPPSTVLGAFHEFGGEKEMLEYRFNNHEGGGSLHETRQVEWLAALG